MQDFNQWISGKFEKIMHKILKVHVSSSPPSFLFPRTFHKSFALYSTLVINIKVSGFFFFFKNNFEYK